MPIKGITERRRPTRGGHLRLGEMKLAKNGKEYPSKLDFFRADFEDKSLEDELYRLYGKEPKRVTVIFHSDNPADVFDQWYKCYGSSGLKCRGNGETAMRVNDQGGYDEVECPGPEECPYALERGQGGKPGCKMLATLQFFIKGLPGLNIYQINTSSYNSIVNLNTGLDMLRLIRGHKGIAGLPVDLLLVPQQAQANGRAVEIYVMKLDVNVRLDEVLGLPSGFAPRELPPPDESRDPLLYPENGFRPDNVPDADDVVDAEATPVTREPGEDDEPTGAALETDPDITDAFAAAGFTAVKKRAWLNRAVEAGLSKPALLEQIAAHAQPAQPAAKPSGTNGSRRSEPPSATDDDF